jgi:hypothetical protein
MTSRGGKNKKKKEGIVVNSVENTVEILVAFFVVLTWVITTRSYPHFQEKNQDIVLIVFYDFCF